MTSRRGTLGSAACVLAPLVLAAGCSYPDTSERLNDEVVVTRFDRAANFSAYTTFAVRPDVPLLGSDGATTTLLDAASAATLVEAMTRNMIARGYRRADDPQTADLGVEVAVTSRVNVQEVCYPYAYWGTYWTPYYWGYGGYPYYAPWGCSFTTWQSGSVVFDVLDLMSLAGTRAQLPSNDGGLAPDVVAPPVRAIWFGATYGVLSAATPENVARGVAGIDQAFLQSPYLRK